MIADGTVLAGRYVIESLIGDGGMGRVYRARHVSVGRVFAIKVLHASLVVDPKLVARFRREAELVGRLRNEHLVSVVDMGITDDDEHYIVLEYAPGERLTALMDGPLPEARVLNLVRQLCDGLAHAHDAGLLHRDFKPDNVLVERLPDGREHARIVDFGVAILREHAGDVDGDRLTQKGLVVGTPMYMAPEQARGAATDHRIDLFALGVIMYGMLSGRSPFDGTGADVARANVHVPTPPMRSRAPGVHVDPRLESIVAKLLAKQPDDRYPSAAAVRDAIDDYMRTRDATPIATPAEDDDDDDDVSPPRRRRTGLVVAAIAMLAMLATVGGIVAVSRPQPARAREPLVTRAPEIAAPPTDVVAGPVHAEPVGVPIADVPRKPAPATKARPIQPAASSPHAPPPSTPPPVAPTTEEVARLYMQVGRELSEASKIDPNATIDLWPRYRWIRFHDAIRSPASRSETAAMLQKIQQQLRDTTRT